MRFAGFRNFAFWIIMVCPPIGAQIRPSAPDYELVIQTEADATILLDGRPVCPGGSPRCVVRNPKPGQHAIRVEHSPCTRPFSVKVAVTEGQSSRVRAMLTPVAGQLLIFATPGSAVNLDGKPAGVVGNTGELLLSGLAVCETHKVIASLSGYNSQSSDATVSADVVSTVTLDLKKSASFGAQSPAAAPVYKLHRRLAGPVGVQPASVFRTDGRQVLLWTKDDEKAVVFDTDTGRQVKVVSTVEKRVVGASADLKLLAVTPDKGVVQILDIESGLEVSTFRVDAQRVGNTGDVQFSPDNTTLAVVSETFTAMWNFKNGKKLFPFSKGSNPDGVPLGLYAFTPDGRRLISSATGITVWDTKSGAAVSQFAGYSSRIEDLKVSPDGRWFAVAYHSEGAPFAGRWRTDIRDVATGEVAATYTPDQNDAANDISFQSIAFTADSRFLLAATDDQMIRIWDPGTGSEVRKWPVGAQGAMWDMAVSSDTKWLCTSTSTGEFLLWRRTE